MTTTTITTTARMATSITIDAQWAGRRRRVSRRRGRLALGLAIAVASVVPWLLACTAFGALPERMTVVGTADYVPVPSDGLAIRRADHRAISLLRSLVQGVRYLRVGRNFRTAPGALPDVRPPQIQIRTRDAVRIDADWEFIVTASCDLASTYSDEQLVAMREGVRYRQSIMYSEELGNPPRNLNDDRKLFDACTDAIARALQSHYGEQLIDARGRAFVLAIAPRIEPFPAANLPRDPGDLSLKQQEYRYRLGIGYRSANADGITFDVDILIVPDKR